MWKEIGVIEGEGRAVKVSKILLVFCANHCCFTTVARTNCMVHLYHRLEVCAHVCRVCVCVSKIKKRIKTKDCL